MKSKFKEAKYYFESEALVAVNLLARKVEKASFAELKKARKNCILVSKKDDSIILNRITSKADNKLETFLDSSLGNGDHRNLIFEFVCYLNENVLHF